jgi:hypothetical protein
MRELAALGGKGLLRLHGQRDEGLLGEERVLDIRYLVFCTMTAAAPEADILFGPNKRLMQRGGGE